MKNFALAIFLCATFSLITACDTEVLLKNDDRAYIKRVAGDWKVESLKMERIQKDGTKNVLFDMPNEGMFIASNCETISCDYSYTGRRQVTQNGQLYSNIIPLAGDMFVDDTARRVIFYYAECPSAIGCDRSWTIEENTKTSQLWVAYFAEALTIDPSLTTARDGLAQSRAVTGSR